MPGTDPFQQCSTEWPIAFFPVRIETRYTPASHPTELLVRVFPDVIHVDAHNPSLTKREIQLATHYWTSDWRAENNGTRRQAAWGQLVQALGAQRAMYVAGVLQPTNWDQRPRLETAACDPLRLPPTFPIVGSNETIQPAIAKLLPDRWIVTGYSPDQRIIDPIIGPIYGNPIPAQVVIGLLNERQQTGFAAPDWTVDFPIAESQGMGIRIPLSSPLCIGRLIVVGIKTSSDLPSPTPEQIAQQGATLFGSMLSSHQVSDGLEFVKPGTPTNNTAVGPSGYSTDDSKFERSLKDWDGYRNNRNASQPSPLGAYATDTSLAFGVDPIPLRGVRGSHEPNLHHVQCTPYVPLNNDAALLYHAAECVHTVLWPVTWGYFFDQLIFNVFSDVETVIKPAREYFRNWVRPGGPLPTLRVGNQPYGILPATSIRTYQVGADSTCPSDPFESQLLSLINKLRQEWLDSAKNVPHLAEGCELNTNFVHALGMDALTQQYVSRSALGPDYATYLWNYIYVPPDKPFDNTWWTQQYTDIQQFLDARLGLSNAASTRLGRFVYADNRFILQIFVDGKWTPTPLIVSSLNDDPSGFLISWLNMKYADLKATEMMPPVFPGTPSPGPSLFYSLFRHAALLTYARTADKVKGLPHDQRIEKELVNFLSSQDGTWTRIQQQIPDLDHRVRPSPSTDATHEEFDTFWSSLSLLTQLGTQDLDWLVRQGLDACSHRLDAWITAVASQRLTAMRSSKPTGLYIGAYGFVENLAPASASPACPVTDPCPIPTTGAGVSGGAGGFIHAPSVRHAMTAAVLRSGHMTHRALGNNDAFAVNLSSARVTKAKWILEGVTNEQPVQALLGYQFERLLHDNGFAEYIVPFRLQFPLLSDTPSAAPGSSATESLRPQNVVDGLAVAQSLDDPKTPFPWGQNHLPPYSPAIRELINQQKDVVDAISDILITESVYQLVGGNQERSNASLAGIARGDTAPPPLESLATPRPGIKIAHRMLAIFPAPPNAANGWPAQPYHVRALAEPSLNYWAGELLGPPQAYKCVARYPNGQGGTTEVPVDLADLDLSPLDVVYSTSGSTGAIGGELEYKARAYVIKHSAGAPRDLVDAIQLSFERQPRWQQDEFSFRELLEFASAIRQLFKNARALSPSDLLEQGTQVTTNGRPAPDCPPSPPDDNPDHYDINDLKARVTACQSALAQIALDLASGDATRVEQGLVHAMYFGIPGAIRATINPSKATALIQQVQKAVTDLQAKLAKPAQIPEPTSNADVNEQIGKLRAMFGDMQILPRFTPSNATELQKGFNEIVRVQTATQARRRLLRQWLQRMSHVRDRMSSLSRMLMYASAIGTCPTIALEVCQLPGDNKDPWVGLHEASALRTSMVGLTYRSENLLSMKMSQPISGLNIDEWTDTIPSKLCQTGVAFNYAGAHAQAPQVILLAVPPKMGAGVVWDFASAQQIVLESLDLAKIRLVDLDALQSTGIGQFLPAIYLSANIATGAGGTWSSGVDTVSTDMTKIAHK